VLVVDDEPAIAEVTAELLRRSGFAVELAASGAQAVDRARRRPPDVMLLDYEMPDMDALDVLSDLRQGDGDVGFPVLLFTGARLRAADQVIGLESGATDYVPKGVGRQVLVARLRAALRTRSQGMVLRRGRLTIDLRSSLARLDGRVLNLDRTPFLLLQHLASREGELITKQQLLVDVWGTPYGGLDHAVEQAVYAVRRALGEPGWIETVHRRGYRFVTRQEA
jgi:DNA-binding response OmpR family regulator